MKKYIDTNIFLRFIDGDTDCVSFLKKIVGGEKSYRVSAVVASELVWVLGSSYKYKRQKIVGIVKAMLMMKGLIWTADCDLIKAMDWFEKGMAKYNDCVIASAMKEGDTIVSFDKEFDRFEKIKRVEPKDLLA